MSLPVGMDLSQDIVASGDSDRARAHQARTSQSTGLRICMPTGRNFNRRAFYGGHYEAQDILAEIADVDLICLDTTPGYESKQLWLQRCLRRDISRQLVFLNAGLQKVKLDQEYDLFIAQCQTYKDLLQVNAIQDWKDHCKTSICWLDELWVASIPELKYVLHALRQFDHVFVGYKGTVAAISDFVGQRCHWLPGAVDAIRFSPYPNLAPRVVDVYSMGRRHESIHRALLQRTNVGEFFYLHDTSSGSLAVLYDHRQHREQLANIAKRSRFFVVAPGKVDVKDETRGQVEVGYRYYDGAAAGTVMIGQIPRCEAYETLFPWPNAVMEIKSDGSDVVETISRLSADPDWTAALGRKNAAEALLRHDWIYRWKEIFRIAGFDLPPGMRTREARLKQLASLALCPVQQTAV